MPEQESGIRRHRIRGSLPDVADHLLRDTRILRRGRYFPNLVQTCSDIVEGACHTSRTKPREDTTLEKGVTHK
jgi:hypothetical protein